MVSKNIVFFPLFLEYKQERKQNKIKLLVQKIKIKRKPKNKKKKKHPLLKFQKFL